MTIGLILLYWAYEGAVWVLNWYLDSGGYTSDWWSGIGKFLLRNISIVVVVYGLACMQASGLELFEGIWTGTYSFTAHHDGGLRS
jgi:hypothetical protein